MSQWAVVPVDRFARGPFRRIGLRVGADQGQGDVEQTKQALIVSLPQGSLRDEFSLAGAENRTPRDSYSPGWSTAGLHSGPGCRTVLARG